MRFPSDVGIDPEKLQSDKSKYFKDFRLLIESGISPENLVPEISKNFRELLLQLDFGREPLRYELNPRSRVCKLGRSRMLFLSFPYKLQP